MTNIFIYGTGWFVKKAELWFHCTSFIVLVNCLQAQWNITWNKVISTLCNSLTLRNRQSQKILDSFSSWHGEISTYTFCWRSWGVEKHDCLLQIGKIFDDDNNNGRKRKGDDELYWSYSSLSTIITWTRCMQSCYNFTSSVCNRILAINYKFISVWH